MPPGDDHREARLAVAGIERYRHEPPTCVECEGSLNPFTAWWCQPCEELLCSRPGCAEKHAARCGASLKEENHGPG